MTSRFHQSTSGLRPRRERVLVLLCLARALGAQAAPAPSDPIPPHDTLTIVSRAIGEARRINVHVPSGYASSTARFPVLYMPDGGLDEDFPHVVNTVDSLIALGRIRPVIVVGIPNTERRRDLTGPTRVHSDSAIAPHVGGSGTFRRFIRDELMPLVRQRYRTTGERAIVGESLAGLFIVETFLREPSTFDHYVAFDPSVWWNNGALVDSASARIATLDGKTRTLFMAASADMTDVAARLATLLRDARRPGLTFEYAPRTDLTHATIFRALAPHALVTALR
jgi:predicted alpha/beta superfamily hydrolase